MGYTWNVVDSEKAGRIPARAILGFMKVLAEDRVNLHGFAMLHNHDLLADVYYKPFRRESLHRMYSVGKSLTSLAIGILVGDGIITLSDLVCNYFQEKLPKEGVHPYIAEMTIRDMLCMTTAHTSTTYNRYAGDWVESFFNVEPSHKPGTIFSYDTSSAHVLSALVERLSGMELLEFLRVKCLNKIGFSKEAYFIKDPYGISQGGSGLVCTLDDILKVARLCLDDGIYEGEQLLPSEYLKEATSNQVDTILQPYLDEQFGYGYQIWKTRKEGFCFYGIGGQLALCLPKQDFVLVTMADTLGNPNGLKDIYDAFYEHIFPYLSPMKCARNTNETNQSLSEVVHSLPVTSMVDFSIFEYENFLDTQTIGLQVNDLQFSFLQNELGIESVQLHLEKQTGRLRYVLNGQQHEVVFGIENVVGKLDTLYYDCYSSGTWLRKNVFYIKTYIIDEYLASVCFLLVFQKDSVTIRVKHTEKAIFKDYEGFATGFHTIMS